MYDDEFFRRIREQQEQWRRLVQPYDFSQFSSIADQAQSVAEQFRAAGIFGSIESAAAELRELTGSSAVERAAQELENLYGLRSTAQRLAKSLGVSTNAALYAPLDDFTRQLQASAAYTQMASFRFHALNLSHVGSLISATDLSRARVIRTTARLARRHESLISTLDEAETPPPTFVAELPSVDVFIQTEAVRSVTPHSDETGDSDEAARLRQTVIESTSDFLEERLYALKPAFREQLLGMRRCGATKGPDSWSQGAASARKLVKGVLHTIASNEVVMPFVTDPKRQLDDKGRPTRATKIAWLCQFIPNEHYRRFVHADLTAALALIELLDTANHKDEFPDFETQYDTICLRVEVVVRHLVTLADARKMN